MAIDVNATVGDSTANSYVDLDVAEDYFASRLNATAWTGETDDDRKAASLVTATSRLDALRYIGKKVDPSTQALKWPRTAAVDEDGQPLPEDAIPRQVRIATLELALFMLVKGGTDLLVPTGLESFTRIKSGDTDITLRGDRTDADKSGIPQHVLDLLYGILVSYDPDSSDPTPGTFRIVRA